MSSSDWVSVLPTCNAALNMTSFVFLLAGYRFIRRKQVERHRACMISAFAVSALFLVSYVTYHLLGEEKRFAGAGLVRYLYFFILITHIVLAALVPVLASVTLVLGLRGAFERHRRWARITFPIWVYVSVTGVLVYLFLYVLFANG